MFGDVFNEWGNQSPGPSTPPGTESLCDGEEVRSQNNANTSGGAIESDYRSNKKLTYPKLDSQRDNDMSGSASDVEISPNLRETRFTGDLEALQPAMIFFLNMGTFSVRVGLHRIFIRPSLCRPPKPIIRRALVPTMGFVIIFCSLCVLCR